MEDFMLSETGKCIHGERKQHVNYDYLIELGKKIIVLL
jgi:hypothetical protein